MYHWPAEALFFDPFLCTAYINSYIRRFVSVPGNSPRVTHTPAFVLLQLQMSDTMNNLEELLRLSGGDGQIFTVDGALCMKSVQAMFGYDFGTIL